MRHKVKKIIAKEFLILISVIIIGITCIVFTFINNLYWKKRVKNLQIEIKKKGREVTKLVNPLYSKIKQRNWLYYQLNITENLGKSKYNTPSKLWKRFNELALSDSLSFRYNNEWGSRIKGIFAEIGFSSPKQLQNFIETNRINNNDNLKNKKAENIKKEIEVQNTQLNYYYSKMMNSEEQNQYLMWCMLISFLVFFILRYVYYGVKWSINTLKHN
jgi:predicted RND superfamily exporter protein